MLRRISLLAAPVLLAAGPALAGGLTTAVVVPAPAAPTAVVPAATPAPVSADWSGFYIGGQVSMGNLEASESDDFAGPAFDGSAEGRLYGLHAGYMRDFGRIVAGGELSYNMSDLPFESADLGIDEDDGFEFESVLRAGVRVGFDAGRLLPYASVGFARANLSDQFETGGIETSQNGYYFGGGVEYAVSERFSVAAEVLRHSFDVQDMNGDSMADTDLTTVGLRASYRF